jgi:hypothetical protein
VREREQANIMHFFAFEIETKKQQINKKNNFKRRKLSVGK